MINILLLFIFCTLLSVVTIYIAIKLVNIYNIVDHPGEHKQHIKSTPFVGGVGIFATLSVALIALGILRPEQMHQSIVIGLSSAIIFMTGFVDDVVRLSYKLRFIIQSFVAFVIVLIGGIVLEDLGELFFGWPLQLGLLAIPFTVFAIIGGINIINMIDGIDGLSGSLSLVSFLLLGVVAYAAGDSAKLFLIVALIGAVTGFLKYNLRYASWSYARVFMGDNGSMLIGLLFAWLLIDLSQGPNPAMSPVAAIWLLSIPLMDAVSVMHRRIRMGSSPFKPDHNHLHHILLRAGYRNEEVVFSIVSLHLLIGTIGLTGLYLGVPDFVLLLSFILLYFGYFFLTLRPWHYIPVLCFLHTRLHLAPSASSGIFFGRFAVMDAEKLAMMISKAIRSRMDFWVQLFMQPLDDCSSKQQYSLSLNIRLPKAENTLDNRNIRYVALLKQRLKKKYKIQLRQLSSRAGDRRFRNFNEDNFGNLRMMDQCAAHSNSTDRRVAHHRSMGSQVLVFEVTWLNEQK